MTDDKPTILAILLACLALALAIDARAAVKALTEGGL
jgi:hypothetical protein